MLEAEEFNLLLSMTTLAPKSYFRENVLRIRHGMEDGEGEDGRQ